MATPSKSFLITWVFVFHYYPSEFDGSITIVPSSFLKRMLLFSVRIFPANSPLQHPCSFLEMQRQTDAAVYNHLMHTHYCLYAFRESAPCMCQRQNQK